MSEGALVGIRHELDRLDAEGRRIAVWWRDDDAVVATPALDRLLALSDGSGLPISIAAIPHGVEPSLPQRLASDTAVTVLVHGWRHANHAPSAEKSSEFGPHRALDAMARDAANALATNARWFGDASLPVFVPPWNRIDPAFAARLPSLGYRGLSCFGEPRSSGRLARIDAHLDPVDWHGTRSLVAPEALAAMLRRALGRGDTLGLLTHHLMFDEALWSFCEALLALLAGHPATTRTGLRALLEPAPAEAAA